MAIGKNKKLGKKGLKKKTVDPMSRKVWHDIRAPTFFDNRTVGKTIVNKSQGLVNANDSLKGRIVEASLADLNKDEEQSFRKFSLRVDEIQGRSCLTNFHSMNFTTDKIRSLVRKWQTTIEAHQDVKLTDGYVVRLFVIAFTKRRPNSVSKTTYAQSSQVRAIRQKMFQIIKREIETCDIKELVQKLIPEVIGREIEKSTRGIYPLKDVFVHKVKIVKKPKFDVSRLIELHGGAANVVGAEDLGAKVKSAEFVEPAPLASV